MNGQASTHTAAKRGDIVIIQQHHRDWVQGQGAVESDTYTIGTVTSITRDGTVKAYRPAGTQPYHYPAWDKNNGSADVARVTGFVRAILVPATYADPAGVLATAECHTWPGHPEHVRAYDTLDEVRAAVAPHRLDSATWDSLRKAAEVREREVRAEWDARQARDTGKPAFDSANWNAYTTAVGAANDTYRQAHEAAARLEGGS